MAPTANASEHLGSIGQAADTVLDLRRRIAALEEQLSPLKKTLETAEATLVEQMLQDEVQNFKRAGVTFYLTRRQFITVLKTHQRDVVNWLRENNLSEFVVTVVDGPMFTEWVKEKLADDEPLPPLIAASTSIVDRTSLAVKTR